MCCTDCIPRCTCMEMHLQNTCMICLSLCGVRALLVTIAPPLHIAHIFWFGKWHLCFMKLVCTLQRQRHQGVVWLPESPGLVQQAALLRSKFLATHHLRLFLLGVRLCYTCCGKQQCVLSVSLLTYAVLTCVCMHILYTPGDRLTAGDMRMLALLTYCIRRATGSRLFFGCSHLDVILSEDAVCVVQQPSSLLRLAGLCRNLWVVLPVHGPCVVDWLIVRRQAQHFVWTFLLPARCFHFPIFLFFCCPPLWSPRRGEPPQIFCFGWDFKLAHR